MTASVWSDRPLGVKLSALVVTGAVSLRVFAVIAVQALNGTGERTDVLLDTTRATAAALEADMMHDAAGRPDRGEHRRGRRRHRLHHPCHG